jgi:hypothetical protein
MPKSSSAAAGREDALSTEERIEELKAQLGNLIDDVERLEEVAIAMFAKELTAAKISSERAAKIARAAVDLLAALQVRIQVEKLERGDSVDRMANALNELFRWKKYPRA